MRRVFLAAAAVAIYVAVAPASAQAETFKGDCHFTGVATFEQPLTGEPADNRYHFKSGSPDGGKTPDASRCKGTLGGRSVDTKVFAFVDGGGQLSCAASQGSGGVGAVILPTGQVFPFSFSFNGVATEVFFTATDGAGNSNQGHASFANYSPSDAPVKCAPGGAGLPKLGFDADAQGATFVGSAPASSGGGPTSSGGGGGSGGGGPSGSSPSGTSGTGSAPSGATETKGAKAKCKKAKKKGKGKRKARCKKTKKKRKK
jgi:hypothetical protein